MENLIVISYVIYLPIALLLTYFVARTFFKNAFIFMMDIFRNREEIAQSTNKLFEVGFYLLNVGFAFVYMQIIHYGQYGYQEMFETLSIKVGGLAIFLGAMVFLNLWFLFRGKKKVKKSQCENERE